MRWTQEDVNRFYDKKKGSKTSSLKPANTGLQKMRALGRLKGRQMNRTETAYASYLEAQKVSGQVLWYQFEPMNLRLADRCFYKVDFLVMTGTGHLECHEVKGYWTDDALVKIKVAAETFPFKFLAVKLEKGEWKFREF